MSQRGEARAEARVVLKGRPNVGKSTLWNTLIQSESAIVSHEPGTTRDYLETTFDLGPIRCLLVDTAGIDSELTAGGIDHAAQQLARRSHDQSDVTILCLDSSRIPDEWETDQLAQCGPNDMIVATKIDLQQVGGDMDQWPIDVARVHRVSSHTGFGVAALRQRLIEQLLDGQAAHVEVVTSTASRCHDSLRLASEALQRADGLNSSKAGDELIAAELRDALYQLGLVVGAIYTDDILDRVFSRFCIGK